MYFIPFFVNNTTSRQQHIVMGVSFCRPSIPSDCFFLVPFIRCLLLSAVCLIPHECSIRVSPVFQEHIPTITLTCILTRASPCSPLVWAGRRSWPHLVPERLRGRSRSSPHHRALVCWGVHRGEHGPSSPWVCWWHKPHREQSTWQVAAAPSCIRTNPVNTGRGGEKKRQQKVQVKISAVHFSVSFLLRGTQLTYQRMTHSDWRVLQL